MHIKTRHRDFPLLFVVATSWKPEQRIGPSRSDSFADMQTQAPVALSDDYASLVPIRMCTF